MEGILLARKQTNITSAHFLNLLKKKLNLPRAVKIGHGGTLDKFASGLLVVGIGRRFTGLLHQTLTDTNKEYTAVIEFGQTSTTDDPEGRFTETNAPLPSLSAIKKALSSFPLNKSFSQTAPLYSAKKISGRRFSDLARAGQSAPPKASSVTIFSIKIDGYTPPLCLEHCREIRLTLSVSSGFYVRAFARDLGQTLHCGAYLKELTRIRIGEYHLSDALSLSDLDSNITLSAQFEGTVQNIGFRVFLRQQMEKLNLSGSAANLPDGSVSLSASGPLLQLIKLSESALAFPPRLTDSFLLWKK